MLGAAVLVASGAEQARERNPRTSGFLYVDFRGWRRPRRDVRLRLSPVERTVAAEQLRPSSSELHRLQPLGEAPRRVSLCSSFSP